MLDRNEEEESKLTNLHDLEKWLHISDSQKANHSPKQSNNDSFYSKWLQNRDQQAAPVTSLPQSTFEPFVSNRMLKPRHMIEKQ